MAEGKLIGADMAATVDGIARGLAALDAAIIKSLAQGKMPEGSGLFMLLENLARTTMGVPPTMFPTSTPVESGAASPAGAEPHDDRPAESET